MAEDDKKDHQPWTPKLENAPLFINSADIEQRLSEASSQLASPELGTEEEEPGQDILGAAASATDPDPDAKPAD